jgi:hypothetical protein
LAERTVRLWGYGRKAPRDESMVAANKGVAGIDPKQMEQYSRYAESVLRRYDENRNGYLEPDEWKNSRSINDSTDLNNDKRVTTDEMVKHFASFANRGRNSQNNGSSQQNNSSRENSDRGNSDRDDRGRPGRGSWRDQRNDQRGGNNGPGGPRSNDRNSKNLPSWFVGKDADNDGQVAMAEFSTAWSERDVAEFQKYDHNGDGIITPAEATGTSSSAQIASPSPPTYRAR